MATAFLFHTRRAIAWVIRIISSSKLLIDDHICKNVYWAIRIKSGLFQSAAHHAASISASKKMSIVLKKKCNWIFICLGNMTCKSLQNFRFFLTISIIAQTKHKALIISTLINIIIYHLPIPSRSKNEDLKQQIRFFFIRKSGVLHPLSH